MRIMLVTDQYPPMVGGVPTVVHGLAVDFANRGHQVWVVAPSSGARDVRRIEQKVRVYRFASFDWPTYEGLRIPFLPILPVRKLLKKSDPDIIHIHSPVVMGNIAQILAGGLRKPVIATNHYLPINMSRSLSGDTLIGKHFSNISYSYLVSFCNRCEYVTAPTQTALNLLYEHGLRAPARAISNGIDLKRFTPGPADPAILQRFNLPVDQPLILHVNRLSEEKRIDVLIRAVARMQERAHVALVSTGPAEADLRALVASLNLNDRISFLGFVPDDELLTLRRTATLFTIPSEADLQSLATMEAMACGLPVVAARSYALPELVHHEENGYLFEPGNSEEMAAQMDRILRDEPLRQRMGQNSLKIIARHDRQAILEEWEHLYRRLAIEFQEAKERKQQLRVMRKYRARYASDVPLSRMRRTGDLSLERPPGNLLSWLGTEEKQQEDL
ncbi:glycosyltransferase involved in cell wall biosynthesis [Thermosporothrix hazakensis]|uniref:Glycosyltransferase involved in cell wall biosynthesis n=1 Tax=Thermosporothrix hazakensis TaxID=644383 RepID=A0A326TRX6_THEHA|nr:glycosyltransferase [Thermosporothrix hazakensis]PZW18342.1 glycosyltransferase involved in cell wall biosynthesis [Thermosporothrix hazakensis]GCE48415.1 glycosyl transferase [Thermosporothrix hazakensis]